MLLIFFESAYSLAGIGMEHFTAGSIFAMSLHAVEASIPNRYSSKSYLV